MVYVTGVQGDKLTIALSSRDDSDSVFVLGMTGEAIANNATGFVVQRGDENRLIRSTDERVRVAVDRAFFEVVVQKRRQLPPDQIPFCIRQALI